MRTLTILLVAAAALPFATAATAESGGLSPKQLRDHGWICVTAIGGVHCAPPGTSLPPTAPTVQLLYFDTADPSSADATLLGAETLLRSDLLDGQPCPTEPNGQYHFIGDLGGGVTYYGCHRVDLSAYMGNV
jgi:hypothetical protein